MPTYTDEQIQHAKDLLWKHLEQHNRDLLVHMAKENELRERDEIVFRDPVIIGFRLKNKVKNYRDENS